MRIRSLKITGILALALTILVFACSKEEVFKIEPEPLSFEQFEAFGEIHNGFMTNVKENFTPDNSLTDLEDGIEFVNDFQIEFLNTMELSVDEKQLASQALDNNKNLAVYDFTYERFFVSSNARVSSDSEEPSIFEVIEDAKEQAVIDDFEYSMLNDLSESVKASYEGLTSDATLKSKVLSLKDNWIAEGYTQESESGRVSAYVLAISLASIEWWEQNPDAGLTENANGRVMALPAWVAVDAGGAVVGAVGAGIASYAGSGEVNWTSVGVGAVYGAVTGSTGAVGAVGKFFKSLF